MKEWRKFCHVYSLWNDARLGVLMLEVLAILLDTKDVVVNLGAGCIDLNALDVDDLFEIIQRCFRSFGRNRDSEFVCWYYEKRQ